VTHHLDLDALIIQHGAHASPEDGMCVMEAVAYFAGEPHTDHPECVSPVIGAFLRTWNDDLDEEGRQRLKPYIPKVVGTRTTAEDEETRAWLVTDWMVRVHTPAWLDLAGLGDQANALRALPRLDSEQRWPELQPTVEEARKRSQAAESAAWSAARSAAESAA
jgi:hypothetical protein